MKLKRTNLITALRLGIITEDEFVDSAKALDVDQSPTLTDSNTNDYEGSTGPYKALSAVLLCFLILMVTMVLTSCASMETCEELLDDGLVEECLSDEHSHPMNIRGLLC
jgi:hypothetical protein